MSYRPRVIIAACALITLVLTGARGAPDVTRATASPLAPVVSIAAGTFHACALRIDGTIWCWGENGNGQLGLDDTTDRSVPTRVPGIEDAIAITAGGADSGPSNGHTCALLRNSSVLCWGDNVSGQLGDGSQTDRHAPVPVAGNHAFRQVSAGRLHTCGVKFSGEVWCWGDNGSGQLGIGNNVTPQLAPISMTGGLATDVVDVSAGAFHTCGRTAVGRVYCVGTDAAGQLGDGAGNTSTSTPVELVGLGRVPGITAGGFHSCARMVDGALRCWGSNTDGQIGNGNLFVQPAPVAVSGISDALRLGDMTLGRHQCVVLVTTRVSCWGDNDNGQLGNFLLDDSSTPVAVQSEDSQLGLIVEVVGGLDFTCALGYFGDVWCWGDNAFGQLGLGDNTDRAFAARVPTLAMMGRTQLSNGQGHTCVLPPLTRPHCAGDNLEGQLGDGTKAQRLTPVLAGSGPVATIDAGGFFTCGVDFGAGVDCWGSNVYGQLGDGTTQGSTVSVNVSGLTGVVQVSAGLRHACALRVDGTVRCWGANHQGQLGNGNNDNQSVPVVVVGVSTAIAVSAGDLHSCALLVDGEIACWGENGEGQLGNFSTVDSNVPVTVGDVGRAMAMTAGGQHGCAVRPDGAVRCWGRGDEGQIGNNANNDTDNGNSVSGTGPLGLRARAVVAGANHNCALFVFGLVACWGQNTSGQLGDTTLDNRNAPVYAQVLEASSISAGNNTTCAQVQDDRLRCWGSNAFGQHGTGVTATTGSSPADTGFDSDLDGCTDGEELGALPEFGGDREFANQYDFYDVNLFGFIDDRAIDLSDTLDVLSMFGATPGEAVYRGWLDRIAPDPAKPYRTALAVDVEDLGIDLGEALLNLQSFGHSCAALP